MLALASAKGAPGVTTTSLALTWVWPRPVLMIEADPAGGDVLAGYFAGADPPHGGLLGLALSTRRQPPQATDVLGRALHLDSAGDRSVLAAPVDPLQCRPIVEFAPSLRDALASTANGGRDVIVDAGRIDASGSPWLEKADVVLLVMRASLRGASAARGLITSLVDAVGTRDRMGLLLVGDRGPYSAAEISEALSTPVLGTLADDPETAMVLCGERASGRGFARSPLMRSARSVSDVLAQRLATPLASPSTNGILVSAEVQTQAHSRRLAGRPG